MFSFNKIEYKKELVIEDETYTLINSEKDLDNACVTLYYESADKTLTLEYLNLNGETFFRDLKQCIDRCYNASKLHDSVLPAYMSYITYENNTTRLYLTHYKYGFKHYLYGEHLFKLLTYPHLDGKSQKLTQTFCLNDKEIVQTNYAQCTRFLRHNANPFDTQTAFRTELDKLISQQLD